MTSPELAMVDIIATTNKLMNSKVQDIYLATPSTLELVVVATSAISYIPLHRAIRGLGLIPVIKQEGQLDDGSYGMRLQIYVAHEWAPPAAFCPQ
ncbi:MAG: hypothetical protein KF716_29270 [Anaerolineae bacterium]|nr:hypothetical protein [Anaerolineae bacterium]